MIKTHDLKISTEYFEAKLNGIKDWEIRFDDRGFAVGDYLRLREVKEYEYTGRIIISEVLYILRDFDGLKEGYVIMSGKTLNFLEYGHGGGEIIG